MRDVEVRRRYVAGAIPCQDADLEVVLLGVDVLLFDELLFQDNSDAIWFLKEWVLALDQLDALVLEVVIHDALVVSRDTNVPLFELTHDTLSTLLGNSGDVAMGVCVLHA